MARYVPIVEKKSLSGIEVYMQKREELVKDIKEATKHLYDPIVIDGVVTNYGVNTKGEIFSYINNRPLEGIINVDGKRHVNLCYKKDGNRVYRRKAVDHIVAMTYLPNPNRCKYVGHRDDDPLNCCLDNLYWTNRKEVSTKGFSGDEIVEMFNATLNGTECDLFNRSGDWVRTKLEFVIKHLKENKLPLDGRVLLKGYRPVRYNGEYSDRHEISPLGIIHNSNTDRYMFGTVNVYGYPMFTSDLGTDNDIKKVPVAVHRLVATAFIDNPRNYDEAHHINSEKLDACVWNLEWVTHKENMERAIALGEMREGENQPVSKNTSEQVHKVCQLIDQKIYPPKKIAEMTGVSSETVNNIRDGIIWKRISSQYEMPFCIYNSWNGKLIGVDHKMTAKVRDRLDQYRKLNAPKVRERKDIVVPNLIP